MRDLRLQLLGQSLSGNLITPLSMIAMLLCDTSDALVNCLPNPRLPTLPQLPLQHICYSDPPDTSGLTGIKHYPSEVVAKDTRWCYLEGQASSLPMEKRSTVGDQGGKDPVNKCSLPFSLR